MDLSEHVESCCLLLKTFYLHYHNAYSHQTWKGSHSSSHMTRDYVVSRDHVTKKPHCISNTKVFLANKVGRVVAYHEGPQPIKPNDPLITWSCKIASRTETIISSLPQCLLLPNLA